MRDRSSSRLRRGTALVLFLLASSFIGCDPFAPPPLDILAITVILD